MTPNGVVVTAYVDDLADKKQYTAPIINFPNLGGFALVAQVVRAGTVGPLEIVGSVMYRGDWRFYSSAILRGGAPVEAIFNDRKVVSCSGSRYSRGCSMREGFSIRPSAAQIAEFAQNGELQIQLRASQGEAVIVTIPTSYFEAVNQVAKSK